MDLQKLWPGTQLTELTPLWGKPLGAALACSSDLAFHQCRKIEGPSKP